MPDADDAAFSTVRTTGGFYQICGLKLGLLKGRLGIFTSGNPVMFLAGFDLEAVRFMSR